MQWNWKFSLRNQFKILADVYDTSQLISWQYLVSSNKKYELFLRGNQLSKHIFWITMGAKHPRGSKKTAIVEGTNGCP